LYIIMQLFVVQGGFCHSASGTVADKLKVVALQKGEYMEHDEDVSGLQAAAQPCRVASASKKGV
jgi:hypothetical protein